MTMSTLFTVPDDTTDSDGQTEDERWSIVKGRDSLYYCSAEPSGGGRRAEIKLAPSQVPYYYVQSSKPWRNHRISDACVGLILNLRDRSIALRDRGERIGDHLL